MTKSSLIKIAINTVVGLVLVIIWLKFVNISQILATISQVNILNLIPVFIFMFLSPALRAIRLKVFLAEVKKVGLMDLIFLNGVAQMLNFFIPIRAGEIAKGVYLNTKYDLHLGKAVIWIFIDRFVDFLVVLLMGVLLLLVIPTSLSITVIKIIIVILILALSATYVVIFQAKFAQKLVNKIYFARVGKFILESFTILHRHPKDLLLMVGITILAYGADAAIWYFTFIALGFAQDFLKMYLGQTLSALTYLIPAAPGYVGSAEASGLLILSGIFGIEKNLASAMTVLFHILTVIFTLILGLVSIFSLKLDLGLILKKALRKGD